MPSKQRHRRNPPVPTRKGRKPIVDHCCYPLTQEAAQDLGEMMDEFRITQWDYLLVGDGSCTGNWNYEAGFACGIVSAAAPDRLRVRYGSLNRGTNIVAELMAYVLPLMEIANNTSPSLRNVHIFTDCQYLSLAGADVSQQQKSNRELWMLVRGFKARGLVLHWHWMPRDTRILNRFCHDLANAVRVSTRDVSQPLEKHSLSIYENGNSET